MAKPDSDRELTSTLHLGLRSVVGNSPADLIQGLIEQASPAERAIIESALASDGNSAMVFIHRGPQKGARFLVTSEGATIGRATESAIFLDDVTVSRKHASITKTGNGFTFKDSGSLNGSYVNNESVSEKILSSGDEIQIGKFHLLFIGSHTVGEK
ncbi:MAG: FHA domain-containing protein [Actinomycetota bacterium]|jgi:pSer/pThr/pTyr-binding forkhead associated (FHA) protein